MSTTSVCTCQQKFVRVRIKTRGHLHLQASNIIMLTLQFNGFEKIRSQRPTYTCMTSQFLPDRKLDHKLSTFLQIFGLFAKVFRSLNFVVVQYLQCNQQSSLSP